MASSAPISSSAPETTSEVGLLTAAMSMPSGTSSSEPSTASIAPPAGRACINRPRAATSVHASSRDSTPATWAAASSPIEWPSRKSGLTPHDSSSRNSATSSANNAACAPSVRFSNSPSSNGTHSNRAVTSSSAAANTGNDAYNSRPMPTRCEP